MGTSGKVFIFFSFFLNRGGGYVFQIDDWYIFWGGSQMSYDILKISS